MAVVTSVVAMIMPGAARRRHQSDGIAEEENLPSSSPKPRNILFKPSAKRSWDLASSTSHLDFLSDIGSLDFKYMSGPKSNYSDHSCSEESVLSLSSGLKRDSGWITDIVHWAATAAPTAFGRRDSTSIETVSEQDSA
ncbi:hypothetical protein FSARC_9401 [Fusarium sarcochroum]|uniref:Uncharacterized protein n=1 Tax=Fusarium sarcochroum TaxID=1208366 RepID=A0A8H4TRI6_9HYPO|nr:hypothetical protein FSARC_9401 [Fusarium sarcochroum]